jgi:ribosomal protein S4
MVHPSYQLNPGDMFQVDVEKVLYGTGAQKTAASKKSLARRIAIATKKDAWLESQLNEDGTEATAIEGSEGGSAIETGAAESSGSADAETTTEVVSAEEREWAVRAQALENLLLDVKFVLRDKDQLSARNRVRLRNFVKSAKKFLAHPDDGDIEINELINELQLNMKSLKLEGESFQGVLPAEEGTEGAEGEEGDQAKSVKPRYNRKRMIDKALELEGLVDEKWKAKAIDIIGYEDMTKEEMRSLAQVLKRESENPVDDSKPYATPWRPRPFMSAFAFVPRYLEVNPNICAAVYLRHPVARKGLGEVPTPFPYFTNQLAHNWYLERG